MKQRKAGAANASNATAEVASGGAVQVGTDRERAKLARARRVEHFKFVKQFAFHTSTTFMDYLHGDVAEEEAELACRYEYARELMAIWEAAKQRDKWKMTGLDGFSDADRAAWKKLSSAERNKKAALRAYHANQLHRQTSFPFDMLSFLVCESFPKKDWQALTPAERKAIARFERKKIPPLLMTDVGTLEALGVFDQFKAMAEEAKPGVEDVPPGTKGKPMNLVPPLLQKRESVYCAVFNVDYSESENQLANQFREWLRLPENQERLAEYKKSTTGTTGKPLDRLKDLAAWRLYRECGNDWNKANEFADKHRKHRRPFRDAKSKKEKWESGEQVIIPANEADLFGNPADAREAQAGAWKYLVEIAPREFAPPGAHMLAQFVELEKLASKG